MRKILFLPLVILILALAGCGADLDEGNLGAQNQKSLEKELHGLKQIEVTVKSKTGDTVFTAGVADTEEQLQRGLMYSKELALGSGMLFIFDKPQQLSFWMKNTLIPLDMVFIGENHKIVRVQKSAMPCKSDPCPTFGSGVPAQFVLEVNGGVSEKLGIAEGDEVRW